MDTTDNYTANNSACKTAPFRLASTGEPTDEQLHYIMEQVGVAARESTQKAQEEKNRRMKEVFRLAAERLQKRK